MEERRRDILYRKCLPPALAPSFLIYLVRPLPGFVSTPVVNTCPSVQLLLVAKNECLHIYRGALADFTQIL